jgi:hypothetical protein
LIDSILDDDDKGISAPKDRVTGLALLDEVSRLCGSGAVVRDGVLFVIGDPYEDPDRPVARTSTSDIYGVLLLPSRKAIPSDELTPSGIARSIIAEDAANGRGWNPRHEIAVLATMPAPSPDPYQDYPD